MYYSPTVISLIEVVLVLVPALLGIAYVTIAERKTMASMQRRLGPNVVRYYGLLHAFAGALKLLLKEYVGYTQANIILFFCASISSGLSLRSKLSKLNLPVIIFIKFLAISTPPKPHAFVNLPLQSKIGLNSFTKYLTKENIALSIIMFVVFYIFRYYILPDFFTLKITLYDLIFQISIPKELSAGFLAT